MVNGLLQQLLEAGVGGGVVPGRRRPRCSRTGRRSGAPRRASAEATPFDLASLTKILCTAAAFVALWAEGKVGPATPVSRWIDGSPLSKNGATLGDLLAHRSGLPAWAPFFAVVLHTVPELRRPDCAPRPASPSGARCATPPPAPRSTRRRARAPCTATWGSSSPARCWPRPRAPRWTRCTPASRTRLGVGTHFHRLSTRGQDDARPLRGALGRAAGDRGAPPPPARAGSGEPLGVARHRAVARRRGGRRQRLGDGRRRRARRPVRDRHRGRAVRTAGARGARRRRAPGAGAALGARGHAVPGGAVGSGSTRPPASRARRGGSLGRTAPGGFGHLGYTGTSLWVDRARQVSIALLTNRTALGRDNTRIKEFRPAFHEAVLQTLGLG